MIDKQTKKRFNDLMEGYVLLSAVIENKERIAFITKDTGGEDGSLTHDSELDTSLISYNPKYNYKDLGLPCISWKRGIHSAWVTFTRDEHSPTVLCSRHTQTYEFFADNRLDETTKWKLLPTPTNTDKAMLRYIKGVKNIDGEVYMFGAFRKLYQRTSRQEWKDISYEEEHPNLHNDLEQYKKRGIKLNSIGIGFNDIDGFSKNDIYACGNGGDLWHYDGKKWKRLDPPVNSDLTAILCAGDGYVYIGMGVADILKGKYDKKSESWKIIKGDSTDIFSLAWFKNKVYIGSESGLYFINEKEKVERYSFPKDGYHQYSFQHVTSCDEALLSYGNHQALVFDGKKWDELFGSIVVHKT